MVAVLNALLNASVVTDPTNAQIIHNGGPSDIQKLVLHLGHKTHEKTVTKVQLSNGVVLISKPSDLNVPPWQMVSASLGGVSMRTATWWATPKIPSTTASTSISCWDDSLGKPGAVEIATSGQWSGIRFGLKGGPSADFNHAKIGVSTSGDHHYAVFGDMNQQGTLSGTNCASSQNGRGGLFYVIDNNTLATDLSKLIEGDAAPIGGN